MKNYALMDTYGQKPATTVKILCNKLTYALARTFLRPPQDGWLRSPWHWFRSPFSLRYEVLWSKPLQSWFCADDETAMECMLHLPSYEPVGWVSPKPGDVFLDIGAYVGWYTIQAGKAVGSSGRVVALEPDASNRRQLGTNISLNLLTNCTTEPRAAWSNAGRIGWRSSDIPVWHKADEEQRLTCVETVSVDSLVNELALPHVDWIKMDIEGAEVEALQGAAETISRFHPLLFIEIHETLESVKGLLATYEYSIERASFDQPADHHGWILARHP